MKDIYLYGMEQMNNDIYCKNNKLTVS